MTHKTFNRIQDIKARLERPDEWLMIKENISALKTKLNALMPESYLQEEDEEDETTPLPQSVIQGDSQVEIISVSGCLVKASCLDVETCEQFGLCDIDNITAQLKEAAQDGNVGFIVLDFNTPGGEYTGLPELGRLIKELSDLKPIIGFCSTLCASGGYWLASQCSMFFVSDSSTVGNVGCIRERLDITGELEKQGVKVNIISDGEYKAFGHPATVMSKQEEDALQERVSAIAQEFRQAVQSNRAIDNQYLQGQVFFGKKATEPAINLADANFDNIEDLLNVLVRSIYL